MPKHILGATAATRAITIDASQGQPGTWSSVELTAIHESLHAYTGGGIRMATHFDMISAAFNTAQGMNLFGNSGLPASEFEPVPITQRDSESENSVRFDDLLFEICGRPDGT